MKIRFTIMTLLLSALNLTSWAQVSLVTEIYPGLVPTNPVNLAVVNNKVWFQVKNLTLDTLFLYQSDGTAAGTTMLMPFPQTFVGLMKNFNNKVIFSSGLFNSNYEPWISDGTVAGTFMLKDIYPGNGSSGATMIGSLGNTAFMYGANSNMFNDLGVYKTDGTSVGTVLMFNISGLSKAITFNNKMYFWGTFNSVMGLYQFDASSTQPLLMAAHTNSGYDFTYAIGATEFYYVATDPLHGYEPWVCNGTTSGTQMIMDINPGTGNSCDDGSSGSYSSMAIMNNLLYFNPFEPVAGRELWISNGTLAGTSLLVDINVGSGFGNPRNLVAASNKVYFEVTASGSRYLWVTDGSIAGTLKRTDLNNSNLEVSVTKYLLNDKMFFSGTTNEFNIGFEPYTSDGTGPGTDIIADINPNNLTESMSAGGEHIPVIIGSTIYFVADDATTGWELWKYTSLGAAGTPAAPSNLTITPLRVSSGAVTTSLYLSWTDNSSNEDGFTLERSLNGTSGWVATGTLGVNSTSFTDTGLTPLTMYYYRINAYNAIGGSVYSAIVFGSTLTSLADVSENLQYSIHPNPVVTTATIILPDEVSAANPVQLLLYTVTGKICREVTLTKNENLISLEDLSSGIYFYRLQQESGEFATGKLLVK